MNVLRVEGVIGPDRVTAELVEFSFIHAQMDSRSGTR